MIEHQGIFLPDGEVHLVDWMTRSGELVDGRGSYQIKKLRAALAYCHSFRTAVDVGAHVGMWSMQLAKKFERVHAFEPVAAHRECFMRNNAEAIEAARISLHPAALGETEGSIAIVSAPGSSGDSRIGGDGDIPLRRLDDFELLSVDFMKLDCEGYELFALRGGEETIRRCSPVIIVEQKPGRAQRFGLPERGAVDFLQILGYRQALEMSGDFVMVP